MGGGSSSSSSSSGRDTNFSLERAPGAGCTEACFAQSSAALQTVTSRQGGTSKTFFTTHDVSAPSYLPWSNHSLCRWLCSRFWLGGPSLSVFRQRRLVPVPAA